MPKYEDIERFLKEEGYDSLKRHIETWGYSAIINGAIGHSQGNLCLSQQTLDMIKSCISIHLRTTGENPSPRLKELMLMTDTYIAISIGLSNALPSDDTIKEVANSRQKGSIIQLLQYMRQASSLLTAEIIAKDNEVNITKAYKVLNLMRGYGIVEIRGRWKRQYIYGLTMEGKRIAETIRITRGLPTTKLLDGINE